MLPPQFFRSQFANLPVQPDSAYAGHTYIVTGSNSGLGYECVKRMVKASAKRVIIAVRSEAKGREALTKIEAETQTKGIAEVWLLDLGNYSSIKDFAKRVFNELEIVDGVVANASIALSEWSTSEGLETTLTVNVIGTFLMTFLLLPKLKDNAQRSGRKPRFVLVSSSIGFMGTKGALEGIQGDLIDGLNKEGQWPMGNPRYAISKLLQIYFIRELCNRLLVSTSNVVINVVINYLSPGLCSTGLGRHGDLFSRVQLKVANTLVGRSAEMGSRSLLHAVVANEDSHGKYLNDCAEKDWQLAQWATNSQGNTMQERVWNDVVKRLEEIEPGCVSRIV